VLPSAVYDARCGGPPMASNVTISLKKAMAEPGYKRAMVADAAVARAIRLAA
jgi:hypothetical protein